jgi:hypothetical protein
MYVKGDYVTIDDFEREGMLIAPSDGHLQLLAQTTIPTKKLLSGTLYDMDLDKEFAPGLELVAPSTFYSVATEGGEFTERVRLLIADRSNWTNYADAQLVNVKTKDGQVKAQVTRHLNDDGSFIDAGRVACEAITLRFSKNEDMSEAREFQTAALFDLNGCDAYANRIAYAVTHQFLEGLHPCFASSLVSSALRLLSNDYDLESDQERIASEWEEELVKEFTALQGADCLKAHVEKEIIKAVRDLIYKYGSDILQFNREAVELRISAGLEDNNVTCEFVTAGKV